MDANTKSFLKTTILGLLAGGTVSALHTINKLKKDEEDAATSEKNDIVVPLSKKNFMKAVRPSTKSVDAPEPKKDPVSDTRVSGMNKLDLVALKRELLKKHASCRSKSPTKVEAKSGPSTTVSTVRKTKDSKYEPISRDSKGRFSSEGDSTKQAGIGDDALGTITDTVGAVGGVAAGIAFTKAITNKILENRKQKQLEESRRRYADLLTKEINDTDLPYYNKKAEDRGVVGRTLGIAALQGLGMATIAGIVTYRIMENRRLEREKELDKDISNYPKGKTIKYKFASDNSRKDPGFFG